MSNNMKDTLKQKVRQSSSAHNQLIDSTNVNDYVNVNINIPKQKFEETHTRATFYIENELLKNLEFASSKGKGEKTRIINEALRNWFNQQKK